MCQGDASRLHMYAETRVLRVVMSGLSEVLSSLGRRWPLIGALYLC